MTNVWFSFLLKFVCVNMKYFIKFEWSWLNGRYGSSIDLNRTNKKFWKLVDTAQNRQKQVSICKWMSVARDLTKFYSTHSV